MKISLVGLSEGQHTLNFVEKLAACGLENHPHLRDEVKIRVEVEKRVPNYILKNLVEVDGRFACDRCTAEVDLALQGESRVLYSSDKAMLEMSETDDAHYLAAEVKEIDLTEGIRDTILLALPMKVLCAESCRGLCAGCGVNLNNASCRCAAPRSDPRWDALRKLL